MRYLTILLCATLLTLVGNAQTIKVSNVKDFLKSVDEPKPGDTIYVKSGIYKFSERVNLNDEGLDNKRIFLIGDTSEKVIFDFSAMAESSSNQGMVLKTDFWYIKNIHIVKAGDNGLQIRGHDNIIENCSFSECSDTGLQLDSGASDNLILNCDSYFNADKTLENADGFAVKMDVGSGNRFVGCRAWNNLDDGWDGYLRETDNITTYYENCWAINNGYLKDGSKGKGDGNGFKTGGSDNKNRKHNAEYFRCIAFNNTADGFDHNSNRGNVYIDYSMAINNGANYKFSDENSLNELVVKNSYSNGKLGKFNAHHLLMSNNNWQYEDRTDSIVLTAEALLAPRQADGSLPKLAVSMGPKLQDSFNIYLVGDSTMADYSVDEDEQYDYKKSKYPKTGWGQVFQQFFVEDSLNNYKTFKGASTVTVKDQAKGGRSTRTFFQEGRWREVCENLNPGDVVIMQFGHNDASEAKTERFVNIEGYKEFLRLFVEQTREKQALPIILTPVARNYPWKDGQLLNVHGEYDVAAKEIAQEMNTKFIDLNYKSMNYFTAKGQDYTTENFFMNLPAGTYEAYPQGENDNTHFQPAGAKAVAQLVFDALKVMTLEEPNAQF